MRCRSRWGPDRPFFSSRSREEEFTTHPALDLQVTITASGMVNTQAMCLGKTVYWERRFNASSACPDYAEADEAQYAPASFTNSSEEEFQ